MSAELARRLEAMGIRSHRVLAAAGRIDRARYVLPELRRDADGDWPLPIGFGQTISQPFVVAYMSERLGLEGDERVLEVGTGSGYQTALLAALAGVVYSVEIVPELLERARAVLESEPGLAPVHLRLGDGTLGWPKEAPFDRILVAAAGPEVPPALLAQLAPGGRLILPVGPDELGQVLRVVDRREDGSVLETDLLPVRFVPLTHTLDGHATPAVR
ncbi:MAG TPA: protein-L-isoaspartate(D-aspartate) O-methyltransferase [Anaeromyxobacter sp.]|nr:protein-L-isoaspartate(D-aspartate) O-methyltransferase [Anaeromyxobacter sp.]